MEMKRKKALTLASLSMILFASLTLITPIPPASADQPTNHRYWVMGGEIKGCSDLPAFPPTLDWKTPYQTRKPYIMPLLNSQNITFSDTWELAGYGLMVNLTIPYETYDPIEHIWFDKQSSLWYKMSVTLEIDGYGWIFLNATGDVDSHTFNNDTGVYWKSPSPKPGELAASTGNIPDGGPDGVAGTADDGFGDGATDPRGSSIILLNSTMHVEYWTGASWAVMFDAKWPQVFTTGTASDSVDEPDSELDGWGSTEVGEPWEFYAGEDHTGWEVPYDDPKWNAYVTYVCAWSVLNSDTNLGDLDVIYRMKEKKVREDVLIADINCDEVCGILDIVMCALAFDAEDEGLGPDGTPGTPDDKPDADENYDARGDIKDTRGKVNILDIVKIALDFGETIDPY